MHPGAHNVYYVKLDLWLRAPPVSLSPPLIIRIRSLIHGSKQTRHGSRVYIAILCDSDNNASFRVCASSIRQRLLQHVGTQTHGFAQSRFAVPCPRTGGKSGHHGYHKIRQPFGLIGILSRNEIADHGFCCLMDFAGRFARFPIVTMRALDHHTAAGNGIGNIAPCRFIQHSCQALRYRAVCTQNFGKRDRALAGRQTAPIATR